MVALAFSTPFSPKQSFHFVHNRLEYKLKDVEELIDPLTRLVWVIFIKLLSGVACHIISKMLFANIIDIRHVDTKKIRTTPSPPMSASHLPSSTPLPLSCSSASPSFSYFLLLFFLVLVRPRNIFLWLFFMQRPTIVHEESNLIKIIQTNHVNGSTVLQHSFTCILSGCTQSCKNFLLEIYLENGWMTINPAPQRRHYNRSNYPNLQQ